MSGVGGAVRRRLSAATRFPFGAPTWPGALPRQAPERGLGVDYGTDWARRYPARLARAMVVDNITRPLAHALAAPAVRGQELLKLVEPPVIVVANHASHLDTPLLLSVLPRRLRHRMVVAAAADHFFDRRWKAHLWAGALNAIPIERHRVNRRSAEVAGALLGEGWSLLIYPEGGRTPDGWLKPFRGGAAYLSVRTGRPVVPVYVTGTRQLLPKGGGGLRRGRTTVTFSPAMSPDPGEDARRFGARIEATMATMADEASTDWWTARRRAGTGSTPAVGGPEAAPWRRAWALAQGSSDRHDEGRWALRRRDS